MEKWSAKGGLILGYRDRLRRLDYFRFVESMRYTRRRRLHCWQLRPVKHSDRNLPCIRRARRYCESSEKWYKNEIAAKTPYEGYTEGARTLE